MRPSTLDGPGAKLAAGLLLGLAIAAIGFAAAARAGSAAAVHRTARSASTVQRHLALVIGVGDETTVMFDRPLYRRLGLQVSRLVVPLNAASDPAWHDRVASWLAAAEGDGVEPLIAFGRLSGTSLRPASVRDYRRGFLAFRRAFPQVRDYTPWNEGNHQAQPTYRRPALAAAYYEVIRNNCPSCRIAAADVLDTHGAVAWLRKFERAIHGAGPRVWGIHNYIDANHHHRLATSGTSKILHAVRGEVWLTEVGGLVHSARYPYNEERAARALRYIVKIVAAYRSRVTRVYVWNWRGVVNARTVRKDRRAWDSGITEPNGRPRPGYFVLRRAMRRLRLGCFSRAAATSARPWLAGCGHDFAANGGAPSRALDRRFSGSSSCRGGRLAPVATRAAIGVQAPFQPRTRDRGGQVVGRLAPEDACEHPSTSGTSTMTDFAQQAERYLVLIEGGPPSNYSA